MTTSRALHRYLRSEQFQRELVRQYERFEILAEGGLRTAVASNLRRRLKALKGTAETYRVTCETRLGNVVPDILIFKNNKPRIWIELKDTGSFKRLSAEADWGKIKHHCPNYSSIRSAYFIYVARRGSQEFTIKRTRKTLRFWAIPIVLERHIGPNFKTWETQYKKLAHYREVKTMAAKA